MTDTIKRRGVTAARCCKARRHSPALAGTKVVTGFPAVHAAEPVTLRYLGTAVNQSTDIAKKVKEDLGITIEYVPVTTDVVTKRIITQPDSFDLVDVEYFSLPSLVPSGNLVGMDAKKIKLADEITTVLSKGIINGKKIGSQGTAPFKVFYLEGKHSKKFSKTPTEWLTLIPTTYNANSLGIRPDLIGRPIEHWSELLNPQFKGKAALINVPSIGIMDAAMAIELSGADQICRQGQPDQGRDRQNHRNPDQSQEGRPVPRLLDRLQRIGKPHGIRRSGHSVNVVAGSNGGTFQGHQMRIRAARRRLPRLVLRICVAAHARPERRRPRPTSSSTGSCPDGPAPI